MPSRACVPDTASNVTVMSPPIFTDSPIRRDKTNISLSFFPWLPVICRPSYPATAVRPGFAHQGQANLYRKYYD
jgi:hypothetical protein